jgi:hypothetical protein
MIVGLHIVSLHESVVAYGTKAGLAVAYRGSLEELITEIGGGEGK